MKTNRSVGYYLHVERLEARRLLTSITVDGSDSDDTLIIVATDANTGSYQLNDGPAVPFSGIESLAFNAADGSDRLEINNPPDGSFAPTAGVTYAGDSGADRLVIQGGTVQGISHSQGRFAPSRTEISYEGKLAVATTDVETTEDWVTAETREIRDAHRGEFGQSQRFFTMDGRHAISWGDGFETLFADPTKTLEIVPDALPEFIVDDVFVGADVRLSESWFIKINGRLEVMGDIEIDVPVETVRFTPTGSIVAPGEGTVTLQAAHITMEDGAIIDGGSGDVLLSVGGDVQLGHVITEGDVLAYSDGGFVDGGDMHPDIVAKSARLDTFHGSIGPLDTVVETIGGSCDCSRIAITNEGDLTVTGLGGAGSRGIQVTTTSAGMWGSGPGSLTIAGGLGPYLARSIPLTLSAAGLLRLEDGATIYTDEARPPSPPFTGRVTLEFGDGLITEQGSFIGTGEVVIRPTGVPGRPQAIEIAGALDAQTTSIFGVDANDTIDLRTNNSTNTSFILDGGGGSDTYQLAFDQVRNTMVSVADSGASVDIDRLVFDQGGAEATDTGSAITIGDEVVVEYAGIEEVILPASAGDFDADGSIGAADIDLLFAAIAAGTQEWRFDLNQDRRISPEDVTVLIREMLHTEFGDADLNRRVDMTDFAPLADNFGRENVGWADGDFDGDGVVQFSDFVILADNFGFEG